MCITELEKELKQIKDNLDIGKKFIIVKNTKKIVEIKYILCIYSLKHRKEYFYSNGDNIQVVGCDDDTYWCNCDKMYTSVEADKRLKKYIKQVQKKQEQQRIEKIYKLKQEINRLEKGDVTND